MNGQIKKFATTLIATIAIFTLAGCGNTDAPQESRTSAETPPAYEQAAYAPPPEPHPFAAALQEYFAGGMTLEERRAFEAHSPHSPMPITTAILVDIDGNGTPGMLAARTILLGGDFNFPFREVRVFALYNGEISYFDDQGEYATDLWITEEGLLVDSMRHWGSRSYTLFEIDSGRPARSFTIHVMLNEYITGEANEYSYLPGGIWENARTITQQEFEDIRARYNLDSLEHWIIREDQTDQILAMTNPASAYAPQETEALATEAETAESSMAGLSPIPGAVVAVSASSENTLALLEDGTLWAWGGVFGHSAAVSRIGDGANETRKRPVQIMENIAFALAGHEVSFAIDNDGTLWGWGSNLLGYLGNGTREAALYPVPIMENVVYVAMPQIMMNSHVCEGHCRTYAIDADGVLWAWGNGSGEHVAWAVALGDGYQEDRLLPVPIMENVTHVVPTPNGGFAYTNDGQRWHWHGGMSRREFADGAWVTTEIPAQLYPVPVPANNPGYTVSHGGSFFAINDNGDLTAWGRNRLAGHWREGPTLGNGTTIDRDEPVLILQNIASVTVMGNNAYAIGADGGLWTWGGEWGTLRIAEGEGILWEFARTLNPAGDSYFEDGLRWIGSGNYADYGLRLSPVRILDNVTAVIPTYFILDHGWVRGARTFAITDTGAVYAWGANVPFSWLNGSLLGDGTSEFRPYPVRIFAGR